MVKLTVPERKELSLLFSSFEIDERKVKPTGHIWFTRKFQSSGRLVRFQEREGKTQAVIRQVIG